jgi:TonB family protein
LAAFLIGCLYSTVCYAQNVLVVEYHKKPAIVRSARGSRPIVEVEGKRVVAAGDRFALHKVPEFYPVFISVRNINVRTTALELMGSGSTINNQFEFRANFMSPYRLDDVFFVLELNFEDGNKSYFLHEIGQLEPNQPKSLNLVVPTGFALGRGHYQFHIFTDGLEVLHSEQPFAFREGMLDRMVAKRVVGRKDGPPEFFIGPSPEYPAKLAKSKIKGRAVVRMRIRTTGAVVDPVLVQADNPAFGEAALTSVRQWRFFPAMKNGRPVETVVSLPVVFEPSEPADQKS